MKSPSTISVCPTSHDVLCTTSPSDASRYVAWVSAAGAIVWGVTVGGFVYYGLRFDGPLLLMLIATVLHIGQAATSAISFKLGAALAAIAFAIAAVVLIVDYQSFALLTTPLICSACAIIIARRHALPQTNNVG